MVFSGIEKSSLVDFGDKLTCTVFTHGCNYRCPFCHNSQLVTASSSVNIDEDEVLSFLKKRKALLDAVCVSGGEPTLHQEIYGFLEKVKVLGYQTKLDTNGTNPEFLSKLINDGLVDYVAMDIKTSFENYPKITDTKNPNTEKVKQSLDFLINSKTDFELRTTLVAEYHSEEDFIKISKAVAGTKRYYLQKYVDRGTCITGGLTEVDKQTAEKYKGILSQTVKNVYLRGY